MHKSHEVRGLDVKSVFAAQQGARQIRHAVAAWRPGMSLRLRLVLLVGLALALVIGATTYWETRTFETALDRDLRDTARSTAEAAADDMELRPEPFATSSTELDSMLREFLEAVPALREITIVTGDGPAAQVLASTSSGDHAASVALAQHAVAHEPVWAQDVPFLPRVAVAVERDGRRLGAVVVTVSLEAVAQLRNRGRLLGAGFSIAAIVLATLLIDLLARRMIHRPLSQIRHTMARAGAGDLTARVGAARRDEIGAIAIGLNQMLAQLEQYNVALQERVRDATDELRLRNEELVQDYHRILGLREALARAEQMAAVGQMAATVAHQIGTPLNLISGYVQLMKEQASGDRRTADRLQVVEEQIAKVTAVVRTLLDHARLPSPREVVDPADLIHRVCELARPKLDAACVSLELSIADPLTPLLADAVQLELALLNIVANSLDAMPQGGALMVTAGSTTEGIWIEIADTGLGIPAGLLPRIFEPWLTTKPAGRGTGLGLSITKEVIIGHGGSIVAANGPERGAIFRIELPEAIARAADTPVVSARVM
jgi:two-component system, NtrC family, sensor kinase